MERLKAHLTAVVREDNQTHILKAMFIDETTLYFQMHNRTTNKTTPCFILPANYASAKWVKQDAVTKAIDARVRLTKNVNRITLVAYFNLFKLRFLADQYQKL